MLYFDYGLHYALINSLKSVACLVMAKSQKIAGLQAPTVGRPSRSCNRRTHSAFTLVELLVVVAIAGILMALLFPALESSKARAQAVACMNNKRQLTLAWTMYSGDNGDRLAYNLASDPSTVGASFSTIQAQNWVNNIMDWELSPDNTNADFINNSPLAFYVNWSPKLFKCPADSALSDVQKRAGWHYGRVRSVSMNAMVGNPGPALQWGRNTNNPDYSQFLTEADIPAPSSIMVFLDEHPDSINDGYFLVTDDGQWDSLPGSYHSGGGCISFADGHTIIHHWINSSTVRPPRPDAAGLPLSLRGNDLTDYQWVLQHSSTYKN